MRLLSGAPGNPGGLKSSRRAGILYNGSDF